jgi:hypothetical protein
MAGNGNSTGSRTYITGSVLLARLPADRRSRELLRLSFLTIRTIVSMARKTTSSKIHTSTPGPNQNVSVGRCATNSDRAHKHNAVDQLTVGYHISDSASVSDVPHDV